MHVRQTLALAPILAFPANDLPSNGPWSEPVTVDRGAVSAPTVSVDDDDRAAVAWRRGPREIRAVVPRAGVVTVARSATQRLLTPEIATTTGGAVVVWTRAGRVESRRVAGSGRLSSVSRLSPVGRDAFGPTFVGGSGGTVLAWQLGAEEPELQLGVPRSDGTFAGTLRYALDSLVGLDVTTTRGGGLLAAYTRRRASDGRVELMVAEQAPRSSRLVEIARMREPVPPATPTEPRVLVTPGGRSLVAWLEADRVMLAERPRGGEFGQPVAIAAGARPRGLALVPKADGTILASWVSGGALRVADTAGGVSRTLATGIADYVASADGRGAAHFGWVADGRAQTRLIDDAERIGTRRTLSAPGERVRELALSAGARDVVAAWATRGGSIRVSSR